MPIRWNIEDSARFEALNEKEREAYTLMGETLLISADVPRVTKGTIPVICSRLRLRHITRRCVESIEQSLGYPLEQFLEKVQGLHVNGYLESTSSWMKHHMEREVVNVTKAELRKLADEPVEPLKEPVSG